MPFEYRPFRQRQSLSLRLRQPASQTARRIPAHSDAPLWTSFIHELGRLTSWRTDRLTDWLADWLATFRRVQHLMLSTIAVSLYCIYHYRRSSSRTADQLLAQPANYLCMRACVYGTSLSRSWAEMPFVRSYSCHNWHLIKALPTAHQLTPCRELAPRTETKFKLCWILLESWSKSKRVERKGKESE